MEKGKLIEKLNTLSTKNKVKSALFAAELVLPVFESLKPKDNRVRRAIELGKTATDAAYAATDAATDAANAAYAAAYAAANAAAAAAADAYAAYAAAYAAADAAYAAYAAANAATDADADAAYAAAYAIRKAILAGAKKKTIYDYMCRIESSD
jgi:hypothetical protein